MAAWFRRKSESEGGEGRGRTVVMAEGLWIKCESCKEIIYRAEVEKAGRVCPKCRYPFRISARDRIALLADAGSFEPHVEGLATTDPLGFKDTKRYRDRVKAAREKTGMEEAVICGLARIGDHPVVLAVFEFGFLGGSMGSVVGEKLTRAIELALDKHVPVLVVAASGGARMQEGILSLMQMAKTASALARLGAAHLPCITVLTDPTTGGVTASFAMLGDVIMAEPRALIGFAGPRVIAETIKQPLPEGFQRSEFLLEHGQIDLIVERRELRDLLRRILGFFEERDAALHMGGLEGPSSTANPPGLGDAPVESGRPSTTAPTPAAQGDAAAESGRASTLPPKPTDARRRPGAAGAHLESPGPP